MHKELLEKASHEQLKEFLCEAFEELKYKDKEMYEELEEDLYVLIYGEHFNEYTLRKATEKFKNQDGTIGAHWTLEQTNKVANENKIEFTHFNEYDFNYVLNMVYSDFYGYVNNTIESYVNLAKAFLFDKDGKKGKAYRYYKMLEC